jgi:predicted nucleic acid-binding protein
MVIADTSVWIEYLKVKEPCRSGLAALLEDNELLAMEVIFAELLQGARDHKEAAIINEFWTLLPKQPEGGLLLKAGWESSKHKWMSKGVGLIDSAIVTMARTVQARVWTLDRKLQAILTREEIFQPAR